MNLYTWHCYYGLQWHICQGDENYTEIEAIKADTGTQKAVAGQGTARQQSTRTAGAKAPSPITSTLRT